MQRNQKGFTLIELVIVIVILGILSAFALPRFADLGGDARVASIEGAAGAVRSASSIARSACLADSDCDESLDNQDVDLEGGPIDMKFGYPTAQDMIVAAQLGESETDDGNFILNINTNDEDELTIRNRGRDADDCQVSYTEASDGNTPTITVSTDGC